jgi:hypothetical protein
VQYLSLFLVLLYVFGGSVCLVFYGIESALLALTTIIPCLHNIVISLCCCNVDRFIPIITILRYDYKPILNTIVKNCLWLLFITHEPTFKFVHNKLPPSQCLLLHVLQFHVYFFIILSLLMMFTKCLCKIRKNLVRKF